MDAQPSAGAGTRPDPRAEPGAQPPAVPVPPYGAGTLAELLPSIAAALGAAGFTDTLGLLGGETAGRGDVRSAVLLVVDGLGWELLHRYARYAPFLTGLAAGGRPLATGFPTTTATSITSIGTGATPSRHGIVGYRLATPERDGLLDALRWEVDGRPAPPGLAPEAVQPTPTVFETAAGALCAHVVAPAYQDGSGFTRAALRGAAFHRGSVAGELVAEAATAASAPGALVYAYHGDLDLVGHRHGPGSLPWRVQLSVVDRIAESLATALPAGTLLAVTGDHGMVPVGEHARVDFDASPEMAAGVVLLGGEPRARHLYVRPGAVADVAATWRAVLGDRMWVVPGEQAIDEGWFGPSVSAAARARIGDVVAAAYGDVAVVRRTADPGQAALAGHHGSLTAMERLVPLLVTVP